MKKVIAGLLTLACLLSLSACGAKKPQETAANETAKPEQTAAVTVEPTAETVEPTAETAVVTFTDDCGRTMELPTEIGKVAVTGPLAQIVIFSLAPDLMVGIATNWDKTAEQFFDRKYYDLPLIGQLYGGKGEINLEELLKSDPDVVIDIGEQKGGITEDLDKLAEQTGIPFAHFDATTETMPDCYRKLGELLNLGEQAEELAAYCSSVYESSKALAEGAEHKPTLLYLLGDEGLNVIAKGSYHSEVLDLMGENAAVIENPTAKGTGNETDMEQILLWNPEIILFAPGSVYDEVGSDSTWQQLDAIQNGRYYEAPFGPYNWLGFPPSVQRYLGMLWLGELLYPDRAEYALYTEVCRYFSLFYHCDLTREQYDTLIQNSL